MLAFNWRLCTVYLDEIDNDFPIEKCQNSFDEVAAAATKVNFQLMKKKIKFFDKQNGANEKVEKRSANEQMARDAAENKNTIPKKCT